MKWKHKQTGWLAQTHYYKLEFSKEAFFSYEVGGMKHTTYLPIEMIKLDENWEEIADDRWLDETFTVRAFMEAFAMLISSDGASHDSFVAKNMVDKRIRLNYQPIKLD